MTIYRDGPGRDLTDVAFEVSLVDLIGTCDYDMDDDGGSVTLNYAVLMAATRGPAATTDRVEVPFFVALSDGAQNIWAKEVFRTVLVFDEFAVRISSFEEIRQVIPLRSTAEAEEFESFVGLQLTRGQLDDIRRLGGY